MEGMKYVGVWVPEATHTELKVAAARAGMPMTELLKKIIEGFLNDEEKVEKSAD